MKRSSTLWAAGAAIPYRWVQSLTKDFITRTPWLVFLFCLAAQGAAASVFDACEVDLPNAFAEDLEYVLIEPGPVTSRFTIKFFVPGCRTRVEGTGVVDVLQKTGTFSLASRFFPDFTLPSDPPVTEIFDATLYGNLVELQDEGDGTIDVLGVPEFWRLALTPGSGSAVFPKGLSVTLTCDAIGEDGFSGCVDSPQLFLIRDFYTDKVVGMLFQNAPVTLAAIPLPVSAPLLTAALFILGIVRISEIPDRDFTNSRTTISVIPGQSGDG